MDYLLCLLYSLGLPVLGKAPILPHCPAMMLPPDLGTSAASRPRPISQIDLAVPILIDVYYLKHLFPSYCPTSRSCTDACFWHWLESSRRRRQEWQALN